MRLLFAGYTKSPHDSNSSQHCVTSQNLTGPVSATLPLSQYLWFYLTGGKHLDHYSLWEMGREKRKGERASTNPLSALQAESSLYPLNKSDECETASTQLILFRDVLATRRRRLCLLKLPFSALISIPFRVSFDPCRKMEGGSLLIDAKGLSIFKFQLA